MSDFYTVEELKEKFVLPEFRLEIAKWVEENLRPLENDIEYVMLVGQKCAPLTGDHLEQIIQMFDPFVVAGSRGHGTGHHKRDIAHAYALAVDSFQNTSVFYSEAIAGFLAGAYHELGAAFTVRYHDKNYCVGHAEAGAYVAYHMLKNYLPEHVCLLVAYAIAAHTHYTADFVSADGYNRKVWKDTLVPNRGRQARLSVWLCRMADRLDNLGSAHLARTFDAWADMTIFGGADLRPNGTWNIADENSLKNLLVPDYKSSDGKATAFTMVIGYGASAIQLKPFYNIHDHRFPNMQMLKSRKLEEIVLIANSVNVKSTENPGLDKLIGILDRVEMTSIYGTHQYELIKTAWDSLTEAQQVQWSPILETSDTLYTNWLDFLLKTVSKSEIFPGFDNKTFFNNYLK